jgi:hypothetical protein
MDKVSPNLNVVKEPIALVESRLSLEEGYLSGLDQLRGRRRWKGDEWKKK